MSAAHEILRRTGLTWFGAAVLAAGVAACAAAPLDVFQGQQPVVVRTTDLDDPSPRMAGDGLVVRGAIQATSPDRRFGGLSALVVEEDGRTFTAVSDRGYRFRGRFRHDASGNLAGVTDVTVSVLAGEDGQPLSARIQRDAESLARGPERGIVVAFEGEHRLWRYDDDRLDTPPNHVAPPTRLTDAPGNGGIEALTRLADGRLLALTETMRQGDAVVGWIGGSGGWSIVTYPVDSGLRPTGATTLPDGDVLVLERRALPPAARIRRVSATDAAAGGRLAPVTVGRIDGARFLDNMEGIAAWRDPNGMTIIYLVSDDNYSPLQQTVFVMMELAR